jgi:pimeloyl-ACP methyl ester carboxylesterase
VRQPTLVVASPDDALMPFEHAEHLAGAIERAELFASPSLSHLIWFGSGAEATAARIGSFVASHVGVAG